MLKITITDDDGEVLDILHVHPRMGAVVIDDNVLSRAVIERLQTSNAFDAETVE
jgi:uncharacterized protein (DUF2236 family)